MSGRGCLKPCPCSFKNEVIFIKNYEHFDDKLGIYTLSNGDAQIIQNILRIFKAAFNTYPSASRYQFIPCLTFDEYKDKMILGGTRCVFPNTAQVEYLVRTILIPNNAQWADTPKTNSYLTNK
ncbi:hypothetical protein G5I_07122 [Acromyrmex echinatior]|uniref:Uncharacterized protein n=1 Tax=Acromyrmex echinatior TaxID=103372 RepID=F4WMY4_ACREC|nr:hypothetical protein G5I_07122 [Acromyrmex echinatior]